MAHRNRIIQADLDDEYLDPTEAAEDLDDESFDVEDAEGEDSLSTEEVAEELQQLDARKRNQVEKSRKGRATATGPVRGRKTGAQKAADARNPVRSRQVEWKPTDTLDAPPPRPGMEQRFVRFRVGNEDDQKNMSSRQRGGWTPRLANTVPEGYFPPTMRHAQFGEVIAVGDLLLCERPRSIGIAQKRYVREKLKRQTMAGQRHIRKVERDDHPIDVEERRERPSVGYGRKRRVAVQDDE